MSEADVIPIMEDTRTWAELRAILLDHLDSSYLTVTVNRSRELTAFVEKHWPQHAPFQEEIAALKQRVWAMQRDIDQRGEAIKAKNAEIKMLNDVTSRVNDAIGRAGIHCALYYWEAIDQLAAERDKLRTQIEEWRQTHEEKR